MADPSWNNDNSTDGSSVPDPLEGSSTLDHALLESLFYNELVAMAPGEDFSDSSLLGLATTAPPSLDGDLSVTSATSSLPNTAAAPLDPTVDMEREMLRGYGVTHYSPTPASSSGPAAAGDAVGETRSSSVGLLPSLPFVPPPGNDRTQQHRNQMAASRRGIRHNVAPVAPARPVVAAAAVPAPPPVTATAVVNEEEKHKKLVTQFATLAGRLGITLPPQVLQKLTANAAANTTMAPPPLNQPTAAFPQNATASAASMPPVTASSTSAASFTSSSTPAPLVQHLQSTAAEAIAAVTQKRSAEDMSSANNAAAAANNNNSTKYSKRRKKPRLSDCERKLAELQAEHALLKRHLDNISNAKRVTDSERVAAEHRMRRMLQENAPDEELDPVIQSFTELYSDYGRKRHEELNFHLEQLQRLANPTNFTKMGLWTLGGQSRNKATGNDPIAGLLQKELGITQQQGRKILEQRQKVQEVCSNLKEVSGSVVLAQSCGACFCLFVTDFDTL